MTDSSMPSTSAFPAANTFGSMTDYQLRQTISQLSTAAGHATYASPTPQTAQSRAYLKNLHTWSTTTTPPPKTPGGATRSTRARTTRTAPIAAAPATYTTPIQPATLPMQAMAPAPPPNPPRPPLPTVPQALQSTYSSRMRSGVSLLMQPILAASSAAASRTVTRRGGVVNYADPGSGDELPDAGALDSDDSDFVASGGTRTAIRQTRGRMTAGMSVFNSNTGVSTPVPQVQRPERAEKAELDQSYLGQIPPARFIKSRIMMPIPQEHVAPDLLERQAQRRTALVPIRVEFETETHRIRDCFVWNLNESIIRPEQFAKMFCNDLELPVVPWAETVANQIRAQLEDHEGVASLELGQDGALVEESIPGDDELPECRVILSIDVQIGTHHVMDHIEWDLLSPLSPEVFAQKLCMELGLGGEAVPLVAHAVHEELIKHKKDAIEWGVIGSDREVLEDSAAGGDKPSKDKSGFGMLKDKTGLGLGWGRAPKDGRGPKPLKSVWKDWVEAEELKTRFEELTAEEVERREVERERASRRLRRETSKFQSSTRSRRR